MWDVKVLDLEEGMSQYEGFTLTMWDVKSRKLMCHELGINVLP